MDNDIVYNRTRCKPEALVDSYNVLILSVDIIHFMFELMCNSLFTRTCRVVKCLCSTRNIQLYYLRVYVFGFFSKLTFVNWSISTITFATN